MSKANASTVKILSSLQDRITSVANNTRKAVDALSDGIHESEFWFSQRIADLDTKVDAVTKNAAVGFVEQKQAIADNATGTTNALNALKGSTQIGFDGVRNDMQTVQTALTKFNARISALEGGSHNLFDRLSKLEAAGQPTNSTSTLEVELKALLQRFGYKIISVGVTKNTYDIPSHGLTMINSGSLQAGGSRNSEVIEIKLSGTKSL